MVSLRRTTLDGRSARRLLLTPALGLALVVGGAPAATALASGKSQCSVYKDGGRSADYRPAGAGSGRRIR
ncbi:MAG: hypothetical protein QOK04_913 [Solirubrobacteraceae bacterium]|jgi:hypothetical protein|nr:hypothetical protein [Solirubrobacteraceae bacterium]